MTTLPKRKNIRLKSFDYSQPGYYFITICTNDKKYLFWEPTGLIPGHPLTEIPLSKIGKIVAAEINKIDSIYENVIVDKYVIMPNHVHMIIVFIANGRPQAAPTAGSGYTLRDTQQNPANSNLRRRSQAAPITISRVIQQFKGAVSKKVGHSLWQKSFYDHVIRNEQDYLRLWEYIDTNPLRWEEDKYYDP